MKAVYQISDLCDRATLDAGASKPARVAVIGNPVAHSASPVMHQAALDADGMNIRYIRLEVAPGEVAEAFSRMAALGFVGCNVTVPHKLEAIECCDTLTEDARAIGVVNTITFSEDGTHIQGHNTDGPGLERAILEEFNTELAKQRVMILGVGGGAGKAIATQCARLGCPQIWLINRTQEKAQQLALDLKKYNKGRYTPLSNDSAELANAAKQTDLIINATSLGMQSTDNTPIPTVYLTANHMVYDAIYKPAETRLLKEAKSQNALTANGLSMLLHQGVIAYEHWFPNKLPLANMRQGLLSTL